jgi:hypothetical protein
MEINIQALLLVVRLQVLHLEPVGQRQVGHSLALLILLLSLRVLQLPEDLRAQVVQVVQVVVHA